MKYLLTFILFLPIFSQAQSFKELIEAYEKDCNQLVEDTVDQEGVISYELIPIKDDKGQVLHYAIGNPDTVWSKPYCPEYKHNVYEGITIGSEIFWINDNVTPSTYFSGPMFDSTIADKTKVKVTRKYICLVKKREVQPFSEHFWNWIKTYKQLMK